MSSSGLGIVEISGIGSSPTCMLSPGGPDACLLLGVIIGWLSGDPRSRSAQSSGSSADSKASPGVAPIGGESVKSFKRSDENPARTVCPRGSSPFGSAITNTSLLGNHAVVGTLDVLEICIAHQHFRVLTVASSKRHTSIAMSNFPRAFNPSSILSTWSSLSSDSSQATMASHHMIMTCAIPGTNVEGSG